MRIRLEEVGKKFNRNWLFRDLSDELSSGNAYALTGPNGAGKSTLLQLIAGNQLVTAGSIAYVENGQPIASEDIHQHLAMSAPYLELIEEFTLRELLNFHFNFKPIRAGYTTDKLIEAGYFAGEADQPVRVFSSGMKQRLKLLLTLYSEVDLILLDEPTTNLDEKAIAWYREQVGQLRHKLIIVASNQPVEYDFCDKIITLGREKTDKNPDYGT